MSYNRSYSETITVSGSQTVTVSYPASENGGSVSRTVYYTEHVPVNVNIHVDTNSFDKSVSSCNGSVNLLTGAVVAAKTAHITAINKNAKKVAGTIIEGFFKNVRFEISSQITELTQKIEAHLVHLHELAKQLVAKKEQMQTDYNRTSNRYIKIFDDFNNELSNRIYELNKPAFIFKRQTDQHAVRTSESDLVNTVAVFGSESGDLQTKISASIAKKRAFDTINQANLFLRKQKVLENTINRCMLNENTSAIRFSPVCMIETNDESNQVRRALYQPSYLPEVQPQKLFERLDMQQWGSMTGENKDYIRRYFISELNHTYSSADPHTSRVKESIMRMFDSNSFKIEQA